MSSPPSVLRELTADDVDAVVDLVTVCEIAETGEPDHDLVDSLRAEAGDTVRLFGLDDDAGLAAFGSLGCTGGHTGLEADVRVRPGLDLDLGRPLLEAVRRAAADYDATKPLHLFVNSTATAQRRWLQAQGAHEIRHFWRMAIDLDASPPPVPPPPAGVTVRTARDDDAELRRVHDLVETAFSDHFGHVDERNYDEWIRRWRGREGFDLSLWWLAEVDGAPVAALLGRVVGDGGHVGTLGTLPHARGHGIGAVLLRTSFAEFHRRGHRRVTLGVDSANETGAVRLYESVGMRQVNDWALYELPPL